MNYTFFAMFPDWKKTILSLRLRLHSGRRRQREPMDDLLGPELV
jgi:hypothetical protein